MFDDHYIRFDLTRELALAAFFLMTHWPNPDTIPQLEASVGSLGFVVDTRGSCLDDLKSTLHIGGRVRWCFGRERRVFAGKCRSMVEGDCQAMLSACLWSAPTDDE